MATDWLKMRTDLYRDPKVIVMADYLIERERDSNVTRDVTRCATHNVTRVTRSVTRNAVVGALVSVWGIVRHRGKRIGDDLTVTRVTPDIVDDIADLPGLGEAMMAAGWLEKTEEGIIFPRFFEDYNVEPMAEERNKAAERQARYRRNKGVTRTVTPSVTPSVTRDVTRNVTQPSQCHTEKRREEKREETPPTEIEEQAAVLTNEYWMRIPGRRKPTYDELQPSFQEKLRVYGLDKYQTILDVIQSKDRDKTQPLFRLWQACGLDEPPKPPDTGPKWLSPEEVMLEALRNQEELDRVRRATQPRNRANADQRVDPVAGSLP